MTSELASNVTDIGDLGGGHSNMGAIMFLKQGRDSYLDINMPEVRGRALELLEYFSDEVDHNGIGRTLSVEIDCVYFDIIVTNEGSTIINTRREDGELIASFTFDGRVSGMFAGDMTIGESIDHMIWFLDKFFKL